MTSTKRDGSHCLHGTHISIEMFGLSIDKDTALTSLYIYQRILNSILTCTAFRCTCLQIHLTSPSQAAAISSTRVTPTMLYSRNDFHQLTQLYLPYFFLIWAHS